MVSEEPEAEILEFVKKTPFLFRIRKLAGATLAHLLFLLYLCPTI